MLGIKLRIKFVYASALKIIPRNNVCNDVTCAGMPEETPSAYLTMRKRTSTNLLELIYKP